MNYIVNILTKPELQRSFVDDLVLGLIFLLLFLGVARVVMLFMKGYKASK